MRRKDIRKRKGIRYAEYYNMVEIQDELYRQGMMKKKFYHLMPIIASPQNIRLAYRNLKNNKGSNTPGVDGKTFADYAKLEDVELIRKVQEKLLNYQPKAVRRVYIPKSNGKLRPLGIPTVLDRLVQQSILQVLEPVCESKFHRYSYGFRPNRSCKQAVAMCYKLAQVNGYHYVVDSSKWNQNMVSRVLANEIYCGNEKYLPIITEAQYRLAEKIRQRKAQTYSTVLQPFRQDVQCGCCGERLYWRPKTEQWFCRQCGMWTKPIPEKELSDAITIKLEWIQRHSEVIHPPTTQRNVQSIEGAKLTREIQTDLLETEPNADALIAKILHRAELEYQFCSAGDADPASLQMQKACAEYKPTDDFPHTFYKGIVSNVSLYRDTHIEFKLRNGQTV